MRARWDPWDLILDGISLITVIVGIRLATLVSDADEQVMSLALLGASAIVVVLRRRWPRGTLIAASGLALLAGIQLAAPFPVWVLVQVCLLTVALRAPWRWTLISAGVLASILFLTSLVVQGVAPLDPLNLLLITWTVAVAGCGIAVQAQRRNVQNLHERAAQLVLNRDAEVKMRIVEERIRIARDLHDAVAHNITAISIHTGAAAAHMAVDPREAKTSLDEIRRASRAVVQEIQEILVILRRDESESDDRPVAGLAAIPELIEAVSALGVTVHVSLPPEIPPVEAGVDVAVFRVLQEALTNAHKHGTGAVRVSVEVEGPRLSLLVSNPRESRVADANEASGGFGLVGMRERVQATQGTLQVDETTRTFAVTAVFPNALVKGDS